MELWLTIRRCTHRLPDALSVSLCLGLGPVVPEDVEAVSHGVIKMNIDTDTQWAYWDGIRQFYKKNEGYLQGQVIRLCDDFLRQFTLFERDKF